MSSPSSRQARWWISPPRATTARSSLDQPPSTPKAAGRWATAGTFAPTPASSTVEDTQAAGGAIVHRGHVRRRGNLGCMTSHRRRSIIAWRQGAARQPHRHAPAPCLAALDPWHARPPAGLARHAPTASASTSPISSRPRAALHRGAKQLANEKVRHDLDVTWRNTGYRAGRGRRRPRLLRRQVRQRSPRRRNP